MRFCATLNDGNFVNVSANRMEIIENLIYAWNGRELMALVDMACVVCAQLRDEARAKNG